MSLTTTLIILVIGLALFGYALWKEKKGNVPGKPPLIPWPMVQIFAIVIVLVMAGHLVTLMTGTPFKPRGPGGQF